MKEKLNSFSNETLHNYLKEPNKFISTAISLAFEILQSRGVEFSEEETSRINNLIKNKEDVENLNKGNSANPINLLYSVIYSIITIYFLIDIDQDQSASIKYIYIFPFFWIISGLISFILIYKKVITFRGPDDLVIFIFSTPIPVFIYGSIMLHLS